MREIKYRVYTKHNRMHYYDWLDILAAEFDHELEASWMQYTGLKDINGKEIYEGDILNNGYTVEWTFISNCGCCKDDTGAGLVVGNSYTDYEALEIVGNIYENPELREE